MTLREAWSVDGLVKYKRFAFQLNSIFTTTDQSNVFITVEEEDEDLIIRSMSYLILPATDFLPETDSPQTWREDYICV